MDQNRDVVLVGHAKDRHVDLLARACINRGFAVHVVRLGLPPSAYVFQIGPDAADLHAADVDVPLSLACRSHLIFLPFVVSDPPWVDARMEFQSREWRASLESLFAIWGRENSKGWLISPTALDLQNLKPLLLYEVSTHGSGIQVPAWQVTQSIQRFRSKQVQKAINAWQETSPGRYLNTSIVSPSMVNRLSGQSLPTPILIQDYVDHRLEIRLYIAGARYVQIRQSYDIRNATDLRLESCDSISVASGSVEQKGYISELANAMDRFGLKYASFDIADWKDQYWLLDFNPVGSWAYIEDRYGTGISGIISEGLLK